MEGRLRVAVLRSHDLEARELMMFDELQKRGVLDVHAVGNRPLTPYGLDGLAMEVRRTHSLSSALLRVPFGATTMAKLEARTGVSLAGSLGLSRAVGPVDIVNSRETVSAQSAQAVHLTYHRPGMRLVVSCFENLPFRYEDSAPCRANKSLVRERADLYLANSPEARSALDVEGVPVDRVRVVMPGIDTDHFSPGKPDAAIRESWRVGPEDVVVLYAGRLLAEKGLVELVMAMEPILSSREARVKLVIHGSGPERPRLDSVVASLGLSGSVRFSSWTPTAEMPDVYRSADLVVLPSLSTPYWTEQFGFNLAEAMSCGRPIVATASGSIPSVVGDAAVLVADYSREALTRGLRDVIDSPRARDELGERGRSRALSELSVNVAGSRMVDAFREALEMSPRQRGRAAPRSLWRPPRR